jgi:zinc protease
MIRSAPTLISIFFAVLFAATCLPHSVRASDDLSIPPIAYEKFVLPNGLTVLIHEDHKAPIVAVNVWYHVGSKNEPTDKTGFAHLFEHLMFNGSEHYNQDYFKPFDQVGATDMNGTTNADRTNYFQNVADGAQSRSREHVSRRAPVRPHGDRLDERSECRIAHRRARMV